MISFDKAYYEGLMRTNGYDPFEFWHFDFNLWKISEQELQLKFLCHHGMDRFVNEFDQEKSIITTWFWMSWPPHIGTISQLMRILKINQAWIDTQIVLWDLDAYCGKGISLEQVLRYKDQYKMFIEKLWYKNTKWKIIRDQYNHPEILRTSYLISPYANDEMFNKAEEDLHSFYVQHNKVDSEMSYKRKVSLSLMIADFLDLWLGNSYCLWKKYSNVWVMLGVDEHQYVRFWIQLLKHLAENSKDYTVSNINIAAMYTPIIKGFNNYPKQSKSFKDSSINANSSKDDIYNKIMHQEWDYGCPEESVVYQMMTWAWNLELNEYKEAYLACQKKGTKRQSIKQEFADYLIDILSEREE